MERRINVFGLGKLGSVFAACMAAAGHQVLGYDPFNVDAVVGLEDDVAPVQEPGLQELLRTAIRPDLLHATGRLAEVKDFGAEASFVIVPTPSADSGRFDAQRVVAAVASIASCMPEDHTIVVCSTVSPGSMERFVAPVAVGRPLAYAPQFIALGSVIQDLTHPDLAIIGSDDNHTAVRVEGLLGAMWKTPGTYPHVARLSMIDAEIAKLAVNAYVTMKISFANTIAEACEHTAGADAARVLRAIAHDRRIGSHYLAPGGPYGGPCFPRDSVATAAWLDDCSMPAHLPMATKEVNDRQVRRIAKMLDPYPVVGILGLTYKPGTPITEHALGGDVARILNGTDHKVFWHDPFPVHQTAQVLTPEEIVMKSDAILVATAHPEYGNLDVQGKPTIDVWGCLNPQPGVHRIGRWVLADG